MSNPTTPLDYEPLDPADIAATDVELILVLNVEDIETMQDALDSTALLVGNDGIQGLKFIARNRETDEEFVLFKGTATPTGAYDDSADDDDDDEPDGT